MRLVEIELASGVNTRVEGNLIGTDPAGTAGMPNGSGVVITLSSSNNVIGGTASGAGRPTAGSFLQKELGCSLSS